MAVKDVLDQQKVVIQQLSYSCGPCSLLNILYLKGDFSYDEQALAEKCSAQPEVGISNKTLLQVAEEVGLKVIETKENGKIADLERNLDAGNYLIINYYNAFSDNGHYAAVIEHDQDAFYLRDSSFGLFRLSKANLEKNWYNSDKTIFGWYAAVK